MNKYKSDAVVLMPRLSDTIKEGVIANWYKNVGDVVKKGDLIADIETDKATMELESDKNGTLLYQHVKQGEKIKVNELLCIIGDPNVVDVNAILGVEKSKEQTQTTKSENRIRIKASPLAKKIASEKGINLTNVKGTGDSGRITKNDIDLFKEEPPTEIKEEPLPMTEGILFIDEKNETVEIKNEVEPITEVETNNDKNQNIFFEEQEKNELKKNEIVTEINDKNENKNETPPTESIIFDTDDFAETVDEKEFELEELEEFEDENFGDDNEISLEENYAEQIEEEDETEEENEILIEENDDEETETNDEAEEKNEVLSTENIETEKIVDTTELEKPAPQNENIELPQMENKKPFSTFYLKLSVEMDKITETKNLLNNTQENKLTEIDFIIKAVALALKQNPIINSSVNNDELVFASEINISVANAVENGIAVSLIKNADRKTLNAISIEAKHSIPKTEQDKNLPPENISKTFIVQNMAALAIEELSATLTPPNVAAIALGAIKETPVVHNGNIKIAQTMTLTLTCDAQHIENIAGAKFLHSIKTILEEPIRLLA